MSQLNLTLGNQTAEDISDLLNKMTRKDLDLIIDKLFAARDQLLSNNATKALDGLNGASSNMFKISLKLRENASAPMAKDLESLLNWIDGQELN